MDRQTDRQTDRVTERQVEGPTDGQTDRNINRGLREIKKGESLPPYMYTIMKKHNRLYLIIGAKSMP